MLASSLICLEKSLLGLSLQATAFSRGSIEVGCIGRVILRKSLDLRCELMSELPIGTQHRHNGNIGVSNDIVGETQKDRIFCIL